MIPERIRYAVPLADNVEIYTLTFNYSFFQQAGDRFEETILRRVMQEMDARTNGLTLEQRQHYEMCLDTLGWTYVSSGYDDEHLPAVRVWWMINNCTKAFARSGTGHYWFEDPAEASFFKLQWLNAYA
jgi:hypothetical protein